MPLQKQTDLKIWIVHSELVSAATKNFENVAHPTFLVATQDAPNTYAAAYR